MINDIDEMLKKTIELLENSSPKTELSEDNKVTISEIAAFSRKTHFYQDTIAYTKHFWEQLGNPVDPKYILSIIAIEFTRAKSETGVICTIIGAMPYLDDVLNGKVEAKGR